MTRLVDAFRKQARPIVHVVRPYLRDGSNADLCRRNALANGAEMLIVGTDGASSTPQAPVRVHRPVCDSP
jgi:hypothetical protein